MCGTLEDRSTICGPRDAEPMKEGQRTVEHWMYEGVADEMSAKEPLIVGGRG